MVVCSIGVSGLAVLICVLILGLILIIISSIIVVSLTELIQDGPGTFGVYSGYLSHNLPVVRVRVVGHLLGSSVCCLVGTDLRRTSTSGWVVLPLTCSVGRAAVAVVVSDIINVLVVVYSDLLQVVGQEAHSVAVAVVEAVSAELAELAVSHLLGLLHLSWVELDLGGVDCSTTSAYYGCVVVLLQVLWINVAVVIVMVYFLHSMTLRVASCSVGLSDSALELAYGTLL